MGKISPRFSGTWPGCRSMADVIDERAVERFVLKYRSDDPGQERSKNWRAGAPALDSLCYLNSN